MIEEEETAIDEEPAELADEIIEEDVTEAEIIEPSVEISEPVEELEAAPVKQLLNLSNQR